MIGPLAPDPMVTATGGALSAGARVGEIAHVLGVLPRTPYGGRTGVKPCGGQATSVRSRAAASSARKRS
jgi:hypothetical protein